ncbi:hypothetical protein [Streptomyces sp. E1N211]|uniref:hypothetical protein n=1 Tax=Streptomyces sp. E1N211 TaxID=1851876 RepID=UPI000EF72382|nr:hypothetical protein [Streptomyces sp. E1N211]
MAAHPLSRAPRTTLAARRCGPFASGLSPGTAGPVSRLPLPSLPHLPPISHRLKPRLATALFRRYLCACIPTGPDRTAPLAGARPEAVLTETQRVGQRHHH